MLLPDAEFGGGGKLAGLLFVAESAPLFEKKTERHPEKQRRRLAV
jgi:hypothetical protein